MQSGVNGHNTYTSQSRLASSINSFMKTSVASISLDYSPVGGDSGNGNTA